jgi:hypothetical protein
MPSASAASVPGRMAMCSSHASAVRVRSGSMQIVVAPFAFAWRMNGQRCGFDVSVFVPQRMISFACADGLGSVPMRDAVDAGPGGMPAAAQMVRSSSDAPMRWKKRIGHRVALDRADRAAVGVGEDGLRAVAVGWRSASPRSAPAPRPTSPAGTSFALRAGADLRIEEPVPRDTSAPGTSRLWCRGSRA